MCVVVSLISCCVVFYSSMVWFGAVWCCVLFCSVMLVVWAIGCLYVCVWCGVMYVVMCGVWRLVWYRVILVYCDVV